MLRGDASLEGGVPDRLVVVRAKEVANRQVTQLVVASRLAYVQVMRARRRLDVRNRELEVEDRLRGETVDRRRPHVLEPYRGPPERLLDAAQLLHRADGPVGGVRNDPDGRIE